MMSTMRKLSRACYLSLQFTTDVNNAVHAVFGTVLYKRQHVQGKFFGLFSVKFC